MDEVRVGDVVGRGDAAVLARVTVETLGDGREGVAALDRVGLRSGRRGRAGRGRGGRRLLSGLLGRLVGDRLLLGGTLGLGDVAVRRPEHGRAVGGDDQDVAVVLEDQVRARAGGVRVPHRDAVGGVEHEVAVGLHLGGGDALAAGARVPRDPGRPGEDQVAVGLQLRW